MITTEKQTDHKHDKKTRKGLWIVSLWSKAKKSYRALWFILLFSTIFAYTVNNWEDCIDFTAIDGNNVIFGMLIILAFIPLMSKFVISLGDKKLEIGNAMLASDEALAVLKAEMAEKGEAK